MVFAAGAENGFLFLCKRISLLPFQFGNGLIGGNLGGPTFRGRKAHFRRDDRRERWTLGPGGVGGFFILRVSTGPVGTAGKRGKEQQGRRDGS